MQFSDLMQLFREGRNEGRKKGYVTQGACDAEGVTAIVRALRDEIVPDGEWWDHADVKGWFDEILGDAGADAAPAVCVWTGEEYVTHSTSCESEHEVDPHKAPPVHCPSCGKPIKFTEGKT